MKNINPKRQNMLNPSATQQATPIIADITQAKRM